MYVDEGLTKEEILNRALNKYLEENPNFDKWKLIPMFMEGYKDKLKHYVKLFGQDNKAW